MASIPSVKPQLDVKRRGIFGSHMETKGSMEMATKIPSAQAIASATAAKATSDGGGTQLPSLQPSGGAAVVAAASAFGLAKAAAPPTAAAASAATAAFSVVVSGQIESIAYPGVSNLYCRYAITYGTDWRVVHGADAGLTQLAYRASQDGVIVFNFPIDISFKSTNPYGWPRIVFSVYGLDGVGRDIVRGYGSTYIPTGGGSVTRHVPLFRPLSSSVMQQFIAWLSGSPPEYFDAKFITQNDGREVTRVTSAGKIKLTLNIVASGLRQHGYSTDAAYA